jgi:enterochelin esterase-like enzyme
VKNIITVTALIIASCIVTQAQEAPIIKKLRQQIQDGMFNQETFWLEVATKGTPIIESVNSKDEFYFTTFFFKEEENSQLKNVIVGTELNDNNPARNQMTKISGTDIWYKTYKLNGRSKFTYSIGVNDPLTPFWKSTGTDRFSHFRTDPFNSKLIDFGFYKVSIAELPQALQLMKSKGALFDKYQKQIASKFLHVTKIIDVVSFNESVNQKKDLLIILDGNVYLRFHEMVAAIQSLVSQKKINSLVIAFVHTGYPNRDQELSCNPEFVSFLSDELIPELDSQYTINRENITIAGSSMGGLAATYAALRRPDIFKNVIAQSSSFQWRPDSEKEYEWIVKQFSTSLGAQTRFLLTVGLFETEKRQHVSQLEINRKMHTLLAGKGYPITYFEYCGGHDYLHWQYFMIEGIKLFCKK